MRCDVRSSPVQCSASKVHTVLYVGTRASPKGLTMSAYIEPGAECYGMATRAGGLANQPPLATGATMGVYRLESVIQL
jgi:hypothetical protein